MTQYHYLDESGDPGLSDAGGSSQHYVLAMVQLAEPLPLPAFAALRREFHLPPNFEFRFHSSKQRQKQAYYKTIQKIPFRVRVVVIDKKKLGEPFNRMDGQSLTVEFITRLIMRVTELDLAQDVLIVDGATPAFCRALRIRLSAECRLSGRVRPFGKITGGRSTREDGLQLADMIAGAMRAHFANVEPDYYLTFENKVVDL